MIDNTDNTTPNPPNRVNTLSVNTSKQTTSFQLPSYVASILNSYSEIFFIQGKLSGFLLLCISFLNYNAALAGLFSVAIAYLFAYFVGFKKQFLASGYYTYNPLLVGLSIGYIFQIGWLTLAFLAISSVLTFVLTVFLANVFYNMFRLQVLSVPFVIVSSLVYLAAGRFSNLFVNGLYSHSLYQDFSFFPEFVNAFFKAIGAIIFMPNTLSGLLICLLVLFKSRIIFLLAIAGFALGTTTNGLFLGSLSQSLSNVSNFNYILIAVAIGGIFNIPSLKSYAMAMIAVLLSTVLLSAVDVFWSLYSIPVFTLPFTIVTLSFVYLLNLVDFKLRPTLFKATPEETLDYFLTTQNRFPDTYMTLNLPFYGIWSVWQGFNGKWTHQGIWQHAYDFVICDLKGSHYAGEGHKLEDYYAFQQPVLSPVRGRVVKVVSHLIDNPIGSVDAINNWGNMIIIQDERGYFVELSHFAKDSIAIFEGSWVEPGTHLGLCGNSGYSPQPHIHVQVQVSAIMGAETLPFTFIQYVEDGLFHSHGRPNVGSTIFTALPIPYYDQLTTFILDEKLAYSVFEKEEEIAQIAFKVKMEIDGTFYFSRGDSKLYFGKREGTFFCYHITGKDPYLKMIYQCLSSIPLYSHPQLNWQDSLSNRSTLKPVQNALASFLNALIPQQVRTTANYKFKSDNDITGTLNNQFFGAHEETYALLDPYLKFKTLRIGDIELRRKPPKSPKSPESRRDGV